MLRKNLIIAATVFWAIAFFTNIFRVPTAATGLDEDEFWARKMLWKDSYNLVITGDSRGLIGLSPEIIEQYLPGYKVCNFSFIALVYTEEYLQAVEKVLKKGNKKRAVLLSISPRPLLDIGGENCYFYQWSEKNKNRLEMGLLANSGWIRKLFRRISETDIHGILGDIRLHQLTIMLKSGWMPSRMTPEKRMMFIKTFMNNHRDRKIDNSRVSMILNYTKKWSDKGIRVYALRIPCSPKLRTLEDKYNGLDMKSFIRRFEKNGGVWLYRNKAKKFHSYDSSHLRYDSAVFYSHSVGKALMKEMKE